MRGRDGDGEGVFGRGGFERYVRSYLYCAGLLDLGDLGGLFGGLCDWEVGQGDGEG